MASVQPNAPSYVSSVSSRAVVSPIDDDADLEQRHDSSSVSLVDGEIRPNRQNSNLPAISAPAEPPLPNDVDSSQPTVHDPVYTTGGESGTTVHNPVTNTGGENGNRSGDDLGHGGKPVEWVSTTLRPSSLIGTLTFQLVLLVFIVTVFILSYKNSGFVRISDPPPATLAGNESFFRSHWQQALLWTVLPNLVFQIFKAIWQAMVTALLDREPYIELKKESGALAEKSISLDYRTRFSFIAWGYALKNRHVVAGLCGLLGIILSFGIVPLSAHLFETSTVIFNNSVPARFTTFYNDSAISESTDLRSGFDIVSAIFNFGGSPLPWMTTDYAFPAFSLTDRKNNTTTIEAGNVTVATIGYSAFLDCVDLTKEASTNFDPNAKLLYYSFTDRFCSISGSIEVLKIVDLYVNTWSNEGCSIPAKYSRFVLISGLYQAPNTDQDIPLSNLTILSCIPGYLTTPGNLTLTAAENSATTVLSFSATGPDIPYDRGYAWFFFESIINEYVTNSPASSAYQTDVGRLIYTYSLRKLNSSFPLDPIAMKESTEKVFTAIFAVFANIFMFQALVGDEYTDINYNNASAITTATVQTAQTRLSVVWYIAIPVISALVLTMLLTAIAAYHTYKDHSILHEEPSGLLSYAAILRTSTSISQLVEDAIAGGEKEEPRSWWRRTMDRMLRKTKEVRNNRDRENGAALPQAGASNLPYRGRPIQSAKSLGLFEEGWRGTWRMEGSMPPDEEIVFKKDTSPSPQPKISKFKTIIRKIFHGGRKV